jgi:hypothetical protein
MSADIHDSRTRTRTEANRQNARQSTGPKDTTSTRFNAMKHGLLAQGVTELDSPETFADFCASLEVELKAVGEVEAFLVRRVALGMVRLKRAALLEAEFLTAQLNPPVTETTLSDMGVMLAEMDAKTTVLDPGLPARVSADTVDALANTFARYETMTENRVLRALNQLERMQQLRRGEKLPLPGNADREPVASFGNPSQLQEDGD